MENIAKALLAAQKEMSNPKKDAKNPYFKSKYSDLNSVREAVLPPLNQHGISVIQPLVNVDGRNFVKTVLLHESGEMLESFTEIIYSKVNDAQSQGSGITYARRYGLQSMVCVGADDDDGAGASNNHVKQPSKVDIERAIGAAKTKADLTAIKADITRLGLGEIATEKAKTLK